MNISGLLENLKSNIDTMTMGEILLGGLATALLAMIVVFTILVLISLIIRVINSQPKEKTIVSKDSTAVNKNNDVIRDAIAQKAEDDLANNTELIAAITGAIVAASGKNIVVRRITRTNNNKSNWEKSSN